MQDRIVALRKRIDGVPRGADGRRTFTAAIRKDAIALAKEWTAGQQKLARLAEQLNLHKSLLRGWVNEGTTKTKRVRPVRVARSSPTAPSSSAERGGLVAVLPCGIRIEGLGITEVIELASVLQ